MVSPLLTDDSGQPLKFFLQRDLPHELDANLRQKIEALGGRIETKVPIQGYVIVQPATPEEERLRECWQKPDRPLRHFVPPIFVDACESAGALIKQIFLDESQRPLKIHIDSEIANVNVRLALCQRISNSGGDPGAPIAAAHVILADPDTDSFHQLVKRFESTKERHVESYTWVSRCIDLGKLFFTPTVYRNPGGRKKGDERTAFSTEDDDHLIAWIGSRIPRKESGGRTGNRIYQELVAKADEPGWEWVARHSWQSWRERYKKGFWRLDKFIEEYVVANPHLLNQPSHYGYRRQGPGEEKKSRKGVKRELAPGEMNVDIPIATQEASGSNQYPPADNPLLTTLYPNSPPATMGLPTPANASTSEESHDEGSGSSHRRYSIDANQARGPDEPEWQIRIGAEGPPAWSKRKLSNATDVVESYERANKKVCRETPPAPRVVQSSPNHLIDRTIEAIANDTRFTLEEVREFYDRTGDMEGTRSRFARMRASLAVFNSVDG